MIINKLDLGPNNPWKTIDGRGVHTGLISIPGGYAIPYGDHADTDSWTASVWVQAQSAVGQYGSKTQASAEFLCRQLEELSRNPDLQPVYVQFYAGTGTVALPQAFQQPQDGFYYIGKVRTDYSRSLQSFVPVSIDLIYVSPGPPRTVGIGYTGGALSSSFGGSATNWLPYPIAATVAVADASRTAGEGSAAIQLNINPALNPAPFVPSSIIADWWTGGCQCHDVMAAIGSNAVPTNGTFLNSNWIEAFGKDHRFVGDIILTNGLLLFSLALTASPGITAYVWNTNLAPAKWQQFGTLNYNDNAGNIGTLRQITLQRVSLEEVRAECWLSTSANKWAKVIFRLQRGSYAARLEFTPLAEGNTVASALYLNLPSNAKAVYNPSTIQDEVTQAGTPLASDATFGYGAAIIANSSYPFIAGLLWQDTTANQPAVSGSVNLQLGDTGGPAQNATKAYGVFCAPFATPQNLQAEAEGGTLGTGWSSQANASASAGNEAKCASGTLTGNADTFGTAWVPAVGAYDVWFRVKVTSAAGSASEMKLGLYNSTDSAFVSSTTYKANQVTTSYAWYKVAAGVTPTATKNMRFRAETTATIGTDWFIDEAVLAPTTSTNSYSFPADHWAQFEFERTTKIRIS